MERERKNGGFSFCENVERSSRNGVVTGWRLFGRGREIWCLWYVFLCVLLLTVWRGRCIEMCRCRESEREREGEERERERERDLLSICWCTVGAGNQLTRWHVLQLGQLLKM